MKHVDKKKYSTAWHGNRADPWGAFKFSRPTESSGNGVAIPTRESVRAQQQSDKMQEIVYSSVIVGSCLLFIFVAVTLIFIRKKKVKANEETTGSIFIYPTSQGNTPHFVTKDIHFSLPVLRSSSLGNLNKGSVDEIEADTECLLLPTTHNQRSNSFSCYGLGVIEPALYKSTTDLDEIQWPEGHIGRLWFSLRYEPSTEKLMVSLLKAKNLPSRTVGTVNSCDPFVRLYLLPDDRRFLQSRQKKKTCNPYFDETLVFQISAKEMSERILKLTVVDGGRSKERSEIGCVTYSLKELEVGDGSEQQLFKMDLEKKGRELKSDFGELLISLLYNENLNRLSTSVIEARRLKFEGDRHEAYVRVTLNQHNKNVKEKRTAINQPSRDGEVAFSEGFNFKLTPAHADITRLYFHVFQATPGYGRDKLIGKCVLGSHMFTKGKAMMQWTSAIANPMEQKQEWQALSDY